MDKKRSTEGNELEPPVQRRHTRNSSHLVTRDAGEGDSRFIYGFTPINGPSLGNLNMTSTSSAENTAGLSFTPPKARKSSLPVRTPVRRQVGGASQLCTPPTTKGKESSRAASSKLTVEDDSPQLKRPKRTLLEGTGTSTQDWMMVSKQTQSEPGDTKLDEECEIMISQSSRNKLNSFRYQAESSDHYQPISSPDVPGYQLLESNHSAGQPMGPMSTIDSVVDLGFGLTGVSHEVNLCEFPDEHCQHSPARIVALEKSLVSSAGTGSSDAGGGTKLFMGRRCARRDIESGPKDRGFSVPPSGVQELDFASDEESTDDPAALRGSANCVAEDPDDGQLKCIDIGEDAEQFMHQHLLTHGIGQAMDPFEDTASFQYYDHVAHSVPTLVEPEDEFSLDDNIINDLIELADGQGMVEPSSSPGLSPRQHSQFDHESFPKPTEGPEATSTGNDILTLYNGVYTPADTTTAMSALDSDPRPGQSLQHVRANIGRKITATNTAETKLNISNDEEVFDLDEEDETELADVTAAVSQERGATSWHTTTAPPTFREATPPCAPEIARSTSTVPIPSSAAQPPPCSSSDRHLEPFVRPPFPKPVRDRSPIVEVSSSGVLRTCFRIGEALNASALAFRTGTDVITELFARVSTSTREQAGYKQHIDFVDLFHSERPPFLSGTYELWKDGGRWEEDSRRFLHEDGRGKMCRAVGRLKRDKDTKAWKMAVLNIWEASWDDVAWAKGIVCA